MTSEIGVAWLTAALGLPDGAAPFPWQVRLLREWLAGRAPRALDLPTGLGKTSVMAIWLVARALDAPVPRRLVYLVDRRAVVDQATDVAEGLKSLVERTPALQAALGLQATLPISTLRGQHVDNRAWLADPSLPAIVVGTVDMIGSRLLFSGYGVSRKMRPYHAGLLGADSLLVLDEAHLVPPFERLLDQIASGVDAQGRTLLADDDVPCSVVPPIRVLTLSATGRPRTPGDNFSLTEQDYDHPVVRQRMAAPKRIRIFGETDPKELPDALALHAWDLCAQGRKPGRIIVFANSRDHAQRVQAALRRLAGNATTVAVELFVGGRRVHEREQAARRLTELGFVAGSGVPCVRPAFVVATSAGEVGVDLDADHAVCDLVAWERMVQRLGRVNRRGEGDAKVAVVPTRLSDAAAEERQARVIAVLEQLPPMSEGALDGSLAALSALKASAVTQTMIEQASTPPPLHPPLTRALVDAWAMTSLEQHSGRPEVAPWIRGWPEEQEQPQTCVIWRSHLPVDDDGRVFSANPLELFLDAAGPHLAERLETDLSRVLDWLVVRANVLARRASTNVDEDSGARPLRVDDVAIVLVDDGDCRAEVLTGMDIVAAPKSQLERRLRGKTVWVDRRLGGLTDGLLDADADAPAVDVTEVGMADVSGPVPFRVSRIDGPIVPEAAEGWRNEAALPLKRTDEGVVAWLVVSSPVSEQAGSEEGRSGARRAQLLSEHQAWTEETARALAQSLKLPQAYIDMLGIAAAVHDEGKQAAIWQQAFHAPNHGRPPFAKTVGRPDVSLLNGYRHEFGSLPHAEANSRVQALAPGLRELCLHLVAAHHGAARPLIRADGAAEPPSRSVVRTREVALRYAALGERWGPWGLAWWESVLRAADQQASRRNDEQGARHG